MLKVTYLQLQNATQAIQAISSKELKAAPSIKVARMIRAVSSEMEVFQVEWKKLLDQHGTPDPEKPGQYQLADPTEFSLVAAGLLSTELEINCNPMKVSELGDTEITPQVLLQLDWFITEE